MPSVSFSGLLVVVAVAFAVPLTLGLVPRLRLPSVVIEILVGIVIGPSLLGWVHADLPIQVLSVIGLAFLLFLAGMEIEFERLRGRVMRLAGLSFAMSVVIALGVGYGCWALGLVRAPLLVAIILSATSLGLVIPVLKDAGQISSGLGQLVIASASVADFGAVILLSLFFSRETKTTGSRFILIGGFFIVAVLVAIVVVGAGRAARLSRVLLRLQDTTAQIRVRGAVLLLIAFTALAQTFGLEVILGAFMAGAALRLIDRGALGTHPQFRTKLDAIGYGFFIPIFFVTSGLQFRLGALFANPSTVVRVPLFLLALLVVRGLPAILYRSTLDWRGILSAGFLQATSLPFIVAATQIGLVLGLLSEPTAAALVMAGLVSVVIFPAAALSILTRARPVVRSLPSR